MLNYLKVTLFLLLAQFFSISSFADGFAYSISNALKYESNHFILIHYHDFTTRRLEELHRIDTMGKYSIFNDSINTFSYIILIDKLSKDTLWRKPCPALTHISISDDEKYIVGLSNIKIHNPFQLIILEIKGQIIYSKGFAQTYYTLSTKELKKIAQTFPIYFTEVAYNHGIEKYSDSSWTVAPFAAGRQYRNIINTYFSALQNTSLSYLKNASESVTNFYYWYNEDRPAIQYDEQIGVLKSIRFNDQMNEVARINLPAIDYDINYFVKNKYINQRIAEKWLLQNKSKKYNSIPLSRPYSQMINLPQYYTDLENFLKNNKLVYISNELQHDSFQIHQYQLTVNYSKNGSAKNEMIFTIENNQMSDSVITEIRKLKNVNTIYIDNIKISRFAKEDLSVRTLNFIKYTII